MNILSFPSTLSASLLTGLLSFVPNPYIANIGLAGSMGLMGYSAASVTSSTSRRKASAQTLDASHKRELEHQLADMRHRLTLKGRETEALKESLSKSESFRQMQVQQLKTANQTAADCRNS